MWEYDINREIRLRRDRFYVTYFDRLKNYRVSFVRANSPDEALVLFTQEWNGMGFEILSVRPYPV